MRWNRSKHIRRLAGISLGILIVSWLPFEDTSTTPSLLLAIPTAILLGSAIHEALRAQGLLSTAVIGLVSGLAVTPITALFMLVKIGLHDHGNVPDFSYEDFSDVFSRTLIFGAAGLLIGAGIKLFFKPHG